MASARSRMLAAFDPQTADERMRVDWLIGHCIPTAADLWSAMIERRIEGELRQVAAITTTSP